MSRYSKLIAAILGNIIALLIAYAATRWPAIAQCTVVDGNDVCTVAGFTQTQITAGLMALINSVFVYASPPNKPA